MNEPTYFQVAGIEFPLWRSRTASVEHVHDMPRDDVVGAYRVIAKDDRPISALPYGKVTQVVQAFVERAHFVRVQKATPPAAVKNVLARAIKNARETDAREVPPVRKAKRGSPQIDIAEECLRNGMSTEEVLDAIYREFPTSKADRFTVANYRSELRKAGKLLPFSARGRRR